MAARAMLLMLAVGGFMTVWSEDRDRTNDPRATSPAISRAASGTRRKTTDAARSTTTCMAAVSNRLCEPVAAPRPVDSQPANSRTDPPTDDGGACWFTACQQFPLPVEITPGEFRVVCSDGQVWRLMLTARHLRERGMDPAGTPRDLHEVSDGTLRWYFIRIGVPLDATLTQAAADLRPVAARRPSTMHVSVPRWVRQFGVAACGLQLRVSRSARRAGDAIRRWAFAAFDVRRMFGRRRTTLSAEPNDSLR
ncbi:MAG: hypothetical protein ACE5KM_07530 [Planctomycetaceae bacterium]